MYVFKEELAEEKFIVDDPTPISETNEMDLFNDLPESFPFSFNLGEELTGAFADEENLENPLLDCDPEASNDNQDQEDETEDRMYEDETINEENYENYENLETENNDNDDIDNNDSTSTIAADDQQVVDHNAAYSEPETRGIFVFITRT